MNRLDAYVPKKLHSSHLRVLQPEDQNWVTISSQRHGLITVEPH